MIKICKRLIIEMTRQWTVAILMGLVCSGISAVEMRNFEAVSPITGKPFSVIYEPPTKQGGDSLADMGSDDDGCRHSSGAAEYDFYIATDPRSYFSAMVAEWDDKTGKFRAPLSADFRVWVDKEFNTELKIDLNKGFQTAIGMAKQRGMQPPERETFALSQGDIPIERRYEYTYKCYEKRGARPAVLAKVALMGAWALRCRANLSIAHPSLAGGFAASRTAPRRPMAPRKRAYRP